MIKQLCLPGQSKSSGVSAGSAVVQEDREDGAGWQGELRNHVCPPWYFIVAVWVFLEAAARFLMHKVQMGITQALAARRSKFAGTNLGVRRSSTGSKTAPERA
jgi:hypothetical protein